ncbi:PucR family transcriptional regulator ligand-binding domain-containing protein [Mycolicibacterium sp. P9-22]|uniref:PucR family transcriptional regulator n=1 Tax=Mycolicibacterium sp. P9-22 TaxID=2024613 RepID=UPI0011EDF0F2|nr:PucR family transcriptional regulator ligand-binding domain-containing protein [Mycolicibacterium sp. P9-22]KAA0118258.1 PucR family transcriptional regulator [Mycolicibacterium sp. P9-22]
MSERAPLTVATALTVPPLDQGSVIAGHRGLTREVLWVDIMHAPAEDFVRPGDFVLTTGTDVRQPGVREFLTFLMSSPAAGVALGGPPDIDTRELLSALVPLADRHEFPLVMLPWEVPFADIQRQLLPLLNAPPDDRPIQMVIGRREGDDARWAEHAHAFAETLARLALPSGLTSKTSVTDDLVMSHFSAPLPASAGSGLVESAWQLSGLPESLVSWVLLPPGNGHSVTLAAAPVPEAPVGPQQFAEVLRQHPRSMATILKTLQPLIDYDKTRRGQLVHTLEILLNEATNTSAAARALYLNRHSLLYRIKLIEEFTGLSLKNPADRFQLEVSVRVHQINEARNGSRLPE